MGKSDGSEHSGGRRHKSSSRMSYLKQVRGGRGGGGWRGGGRGGGGGDYVSAYGRDGQKKRQREYLAAGMRGFLLTTNFRENDCVRDGYNVLNEYYRPEDEVQVAAVEGMETKSEGVVDEPKSDETKVDACPEAGGAASIVVSTPAPTGENKADKKEDDDDSDDIDKALEKEMKELKSNTTFKFQSVDTGIRNVIFIKTTVQRPTEIAYRIFDDVYEKKETRCRNILRMLPIDATCRTDNLRQVAKELFTPYFCKGYKSFKIVTNARYSNLNKNEILKLLAEIVTEINPLNVAKMVDSEFTIVVELLKATICLSVVRDFTKFKKFNITEIVSPTPVHPPKEKSNADQDPSQDKGTEAAVSPNKNSNNEDEEESKGAEEMEVGCGKEDKSDAVDEPVKSE